MSGEKLKENSILHNLTREVRVESEIYRRGQEVLKGAVNCLGVCCRPDKLTEFVTDAQTLGISFAVVVKGQGLVTTQSNTHLETRHILEARLEILKQHLC